MMRALIVAVVLTAVSVRAQETSRFVPVDLWVDCGAHRLAAYQVEVCYDPNRVRIVGLEGGAHAAFGDAPEYDPKGMTGGRIVIAAFTTAEDVPTGRTRVARLHLQTAAGHTPKLRVKLVAAGDSAGARIEPSVSCRLENGDRKK